MPQVSIRNTPALSAALLFPVVNATEHQVAVLEDFSKNGIDSLNEHDYCEFLSGIWAWNQDKTMSALADRLNEGPYYYYVSSRGNGYSGSDNACHAQARENIKQGKTTVPLRYWDAFSSDNTKDTFGMHPITNLFSLGKKKNLKYYDVTGYAFNDFVRFYNWYLSEKNPMFKRFTDLMETFEIHKTLEGYPVGFTCKKKSSVAWVAAYTTVGLFLCMSRFLSEGFEKSTTEARRVLYRELAGTVEDYVLYPVIEAYTTSSTSHRWFHAGKVNLDLWFSNTFSMHESYWIQSFGNKTLPAYVRSYLRSKGFMK